MDKNYFRRLFCVAAMAAVSFYATAACAADQIAKVSRFSGEVTIKSDTRFSKVTRVGVPLMEDDYIQTGNGEVEVVFKDGAVMNVRPYTTASVVQGKEKTGLLVKSMQATRRITCFVGKLRFKSGSSDRKNFLQTPTSVCALRGTDAAVGYDNADSYLAMYSGQAETVGHFTKKFFEDFGPNTAEGSAIYKSMGNAYKKYEAAKTSGDPVKMAEAQKEALEVAKEASKVLKENNASQYVQDQAELTEAAIDAGIAAAEAEVAVEKTKKLKEAADAVAADDNATDAEKKAAKDAEAALAAAEAAKQDAEEAAQEAKAAANAGDLEATKAAAQKAQDAGSSAKDAEESGQDAVKDVVTTTQESTEETTVETTAETTGETTGETTTAETTSDTTTSTTTTSTSTTTTESTVSPSS